MTGFRVAYGGAAEYLGFEADLLTFGKVIGGGMPVGAFGGKQEIKSCRYGSWHSHVGRY